MYRNQKITLDKTGDKKFKFISALLLVMSQQNKYGQEVCRQRGVFLLESGTCRQAILTYRWM